jgi:hypothetical protein
MTEQKLKSQTDMPVMLDTFQGVFAKLRKVSFSSSCLSVHLLARKELGGSHTMDLHEL